MASLSPQLTEQPPQLPRGLEGGALQELPSVLRSVLGVPPAAVFGGPFSLDGETCRLSWLGTQPANETAMSTLAATDANVVR
jgi:hypothetical protein